MSSRAPDPSSVDESPLPSVETCPLDARDQARNIRLFAACTGSIYLCAPVLYVGVTQASLCHRLGASDTVANLPASAYFAFTCAPVLVAWLSPFVATLKRNLVLGFASLAAILAVTAVGLVSPIPPMGKVALIIVQGAVCGASGPTVIALLWEAIGRGVAESRRGVALGMAFGVGPVLAVLGSLGSQFCLTGMAFPRNFAVLFGAASPVMLVAAFLASRLVVPMPGQELRREPFGRSVFGGLRDFLSDRVLFTATIVTVLVYTGNTIASNMNLYTEVALGRPPEDYAGLQNMLRFGFKVVAGLLLGWLLTRTNPRAGILVTSTLYVAAQAWAIFVDRALVSAGVRALWGGGAGRRVRAELHPVRLAEVADAA